MTKGVLIFAQNNPEMDYAKLAVYAAKRVKQYLDVPVSIATDAKQWLIDSQPEAESIVDKIIDIWYQTDQTKKFNDGSLYSRNVKWNNFIRGDCFDLTPYDETLVIDSDYIISTTNLSKIWNTQADFLIYKDSYDIAQWRDTKSFQYFNQYAIPFYWATVFYFKKNFITESFFVLIKNIRENWSYYRTLYLIDSPLFRNDYAFSIAIHMMNGSIDNFAFESLPGKLYYTLDSDILLDIKDDKFQILLEKEKFHGEYTLSKTSNLDMHIMNKFSLARYIDRTRHD
jgi:hypothetical protein